MTTQAAQVYARTLIYGIAALAVVYLLYVNGQRARERRRWEFTKAWNETGIRIYEEINGRS